MSQRSGASRSSRHARDIYAFVDMVRERQERQKSEETEPTMDSQQPLQREEFEPMEDPSNDGDARSVASSQPVCCSTSPPPSPPAPRAPPPPSKNAAMNVSDGRFPTHDPYFHPRLPRNHPYHFGPRQGEIPHRPVYGIPPPPPMGMTREERERVWDIAGGLRDARVRV
uniref:cyclin-K-like n=1 Tax=Erigeron canadensis TaxID=72917 RepID=UPI001CB8F342|nr:cyclin-K-like [Erigeron canadensis]